MKTEAEIRAAMEQLAHLSHLACEENDHETVNRLGLFIGAFQWVIGDGTGRFESLLSDLNATFQEPKP